MLWLQHAQAQWRTQTVRLQPGFNPIMIEVTPLLRDCETIFGGMAGVDSVWLYNRYPKSGSTGASNGAPATVQDHWLMWFPQRSPKAFLSTLAQIRGGQSYLVHMRTNAGTATLSLKGIPEPPRLDWLPLDFTLAGVPVDPVSPPTFATFFAEIPELPTGAGRASPFYTISPLLARETQVRVPQTTPIVPGRAYWFQMGGHRDCPYPINVTAASEMNSVQFVAGGKNPAITVSNCRSTTSVRVHLQELRSEEAPAGAPPYAGHAAVAALIPTLDGVYTPRLLSQGVDIDLPAGGQQIVKLGLATGLLETPRSTAANATYQSFIVVSEPTTGYRQLVAVAAPVAGGSKNAGGLSLLGTGRRVRSQSATGVTASSPASGLWVGSVNLAAVNIPSFSPSGAPPDISMNPLVKVSAPLSTRLLLHVDSNGVSRIIQQACFAKVSNGSNTVTQLYASPTNLPPGALLTSRVSAPVWPRVAPTQMTGQFGANLTASVTVPYDSPVNPFVHAYHPDHNNLDENYANKLPSGVESFDITRAVTLYFGASVDAGAFVPNSPPVQFSGTNGEYVVTSPLTNNASFSVQFWANLAKSPAAGATLALLTNAAPGPGFKWVLPTAPDGSP